MVYLSICLCHLWFLSSAFCRFMSTGLLPPCSCYSVAKSYPILCDFMDCSTPAFLSLMNSRSLPRFMPIESVMPSDHLILCHLFSFCLQSFPAWGSSPTSWLFASRSQSIGAPTSGSVLPMSIQGWFPLGLTGFISLLSKGLSRVFFSTTIWKHQFFGAQPASDTGSILTSAHDYWKNHSFNYTDLHCQSAVFTF